MHKKNKKFIFKIHFFKLVLYFRCIKLIYILLSDTMGLPHIPHTITYNKIDTALKNKRKSNDAQHLVTGVHKQWNTLYSP